MLSIKGRMREIISRTFFEVAIGIVLNVVIITNLSQCKVCRKVHAITGCVGQGEEMYCIEAVQTNSF